MSSNIESNKIFAAVLVAGLVAMLAGFVAEKLVHPHGLEEDAVPIEGISGSAGAVAAEAMPEPILDLIATADLARGQALSKACAACHSFDQGGASKVGPNLWGVAGGSKSAKAGFAYSDSMKEVGGKWDYEALNQFLWKPKSLVSGTKMNYIGLKKPADRAAIIKWLDSLGGSLPEPTAAMIEEEKARLMPEEPEDVGQEESADAVSGDSAEEPEAVSH